MMMYMEKGFNMTAELKIVETFRENYSIENIVSSIKDGTWKGIKLNMSLLPFFNEVGPGEYVIKDHTRIQIRESLIDLGFISRMVNIVRSTKDSSNLENPTIVHFTKNVTRLDNKEVLYEAESCRVIGGNHGMSIRVDLGIYETDAFVLDFETHLEGKLSNLYAVANGLNTHNTYNQGCADEDIKREFYQFIDEKIAAGNDPVPTTEEKQKFVDRYPQINLATIGNWISHHKDVGGRMATLKVWSPSELKAKVLEYDDNIAYDHYMKLVPTTIHNYDGEMLGRLIVRATKERLEAEKNNSVFHKKVLVTIYASNVTQREQINHQDKRDIIEKRINEFCKTIGFQKIKVEFLRYQ